MSFNFINKIDVSRTRARSPTKKMYSPPVRNQAYFPLGKNSFRRIVPLVIRPITLS